MIIPPRFAAALTVTLLLAACGGTTRRTMVLDHPPSEGIGPILVSSVERDEAGIRLVAAAVYEIGKFDDTDEANLKGSLEDTLTAAAEGRVLPAAGEVRLHLLIRKYFVFTSNNSAVVWAGVDWCAAEPDGRILFQESFYATGQARLVGTVGGVKTDVQGQIVKRIAQGAVDLCRRATPRGDAIEGTFSEFEQASPTVPASVQSRGVFWTPRGAKAMLSRDEMRMGPPIDWRARLAAKKAP